jgi:elongation factor G
MSQGRAIFNMEFDHYSEVPKSISEQIVEKHKGKEAVSA